MARASWGSTVGDFSGLFVNLLDEQRRRIEESVQRDIARSKEQQAAEDNETFDQWQNGIISDRDWLNYVNSRVRETKGDPEEHAEWLKTLHEHRDAIRDSQMEARYEAGTLSLHKLIAHYSDKMQGVERASPRYRDAQTRYFQLIDQRDSYYIEDEANRILNRIQRGQAGYGELRDFYQSMLGRVRRSSPLYRQIKDNIQSLANIGAATGGGGGGGSSGGSRSYSSGGSSYRSGGGGGDRDPYSAASRTVLKLWRSGNAFVPAGPDVVRSVLDAYNMDTRDDTTVWNALAEDSVVIENLMDQAMNNPNAEFLVTPWGDRIPNNLKNRHLLMNQGLRGYDYRIALGNAQGRSVLGVHGARDAFVETTFQEMNEATADDYWKQIRQNFWERAEIAGQNPDPWQALGEYVEAARVFSRGARNILGERLERPEDRARGGSTGGRAQERADEVVAPPKATYSKSKLFPEEQVTSEMQEELRYAIQISDFLSNARHMAPEELQHEASLLFDARPDAFWLTEADLEKVIGTDSITVDPTGFGNNVHVGTGLIGKAFAHRGLMAADVNTNGEPIRGVEPYRYIGVPGAANPIAVPQNAINGILRTTDYQDGSTAMGGWEKVGGQTRWVIRPLEDIEPPKWYFNAYGQALTASEYDKIGRDASALALGEWELKPVPGLEGWKRITDGDGDVWYRDPADGHLYEGGPPFQSSVFGPIFNYGAFVDAEGKIDMDKFRVSASTGRGFIAWFTEAVSAREAQELTEEMLANPFDDRLNLEYFHKRDDKNFVQPTALSPEDVVGMFWTPFADSGMGNYDVKNMGGYSKARMEHRAALDMAEVRRKAEVEEWIQRRIGDAQAQFQYRKFNPDADLNDIASRNIEQAKRTAGIRLGNDLRRLRMPERDTEEGFRAPRLPQIAAPPSPRPIRPVPITAPLATRRTRRRRTSYTPPPVYSGPRAPGRGFTE